jgi:hypothetical protein
MAKKGKRKGGKRYVRPLVLGGLFVFTATVLAATDVALAAVAYYTPEARTGPRRCRQPSHLKEWNHDSEARRRLHDRFLRRPLARIHGNGSCKSSAPDKRR